MLAWPDGIALSRRRDGSGAGIARNDREPNAVWRRWRPSPC